MSANLLTGTEHTERLAYVAQHALDGPIRECYLVGSSETDDETQWRTEIGWPIFQTRHVPHQST